jgi:hypothetical protein
LSKTFKALLRAAHERAGRKHLGRDRKGEPSAPPDISRLAQAETDIPRGNAQAEESPGRQPAAKPLQLPKTPAADNIIQAPRPLPIGPDDPDLRELLEMELMVSASGGVLEPDGWLRGPLDQKLATRLLDRFGLLHCLMQDERNWFWFWASTSDAEEMAARHGLLLDFAVPEED